MDSISFTAVTDIVCARDSVPLDASLHPMMADIVAYIQTLIRMVSDMKGTHSFKIDSIRTYYTRERVTTTTTGREINNVVKPFWPTCWGGLYLLTQRVPWI